MASKPSLPWVRATKGLPNKLGLIVLAARDASNARPGGVFLRGLEVSYLSTRCARESQRAWNSRLRKKIPPATVMMNGPVAL